MMRSGCALIHQGAEGKKEVVHTVLLLGHMGGIGIIIILELFCYLIKRKNIVFVLALIGVPFYELVT